MSNSSSASTPPSAKPLVAEQAAALSGTVTLITGDRVELMPSTPPRIIPAEGRELTQFRTTTDGGRVRVIPLDAVALLDAGKLDPRLFDVTTLIESGYDDARRAELPLIVQRDKANRSAGSTLAGTGARRELPSIAGF